VPNKPQAKAAQERTRTRLYLVSPPAFDLPKFTESLKAALGGGDVGAFQLRLKGASESDILRAAEKLLPVCQRQGTAFIMNDSPELAAKSGADGVHIGQDDGGVKNARAIVGPAVTIGVSCHDSIHLAMVAGEAGADYVAFGAFYPTTSKSPEALKKWGTPKTDILEWWQAYMVLPCVAIGGINPSNCEPLVRAGADFIAVITAVWDNESGPAEAVATFNKAIDRGMTD
jgi:thiamine-phosphate pyrophosphorylase